MRSNVTVDTENVITFNNNKNYHYWFGKEF